MKALNKELHTFQRITPEQITIIIIIIILVLKLFTKISKNFSKINLIVADLVNTIKYKSWQNFVKKFYYFIKRNKNTTM